MTSEDRAQKFHTDELICVVTCHQHGTCAVAWLNVGSCTQSILYPASRDYISAVLAGVRKVASADNRSNPSGFFLFLTGLEDCASVAWVLRSQSELSQFFCSRETRAIWRQTWRLIFACESGDKIRACTIEHWTVVGRGYLSHDSSQSENVASARRVSILTRLPKMRVDIIKNCFTKDLPWSDRRLPSCPTIPSP